MTNQHPITPPPELVQQWINEEDGLTARHIATQAARWGANQELNACCEWLDERAVLNGSTALRDARRPKPPSLKEQALEALKVIECEYVIGATTGTIRRALETLDD
jgi:hypothetical protein